jgi:pyridoxine/pyridoxamine 5'-phosphate oxidase
MNVQYSKVLDFIRQQKLAVISTIDSEHNKPEAAVLAISETDTLEVIFGTFFTTRKYANLQNNSQVAFVIGWSEEAKVTVQYEGVAREVSGEEAERCRDIHLRKNPASSKFALDEKQRFFIVMPTWIRYSNLGAKPVEIFELAF